MPINGALKLTPFIPPGVNAWATEKLINAPTQLREGVDKSFHSHSPVLSASPRGVKVLLRRSLIITRANSPGWSFLSLRAAEFVPNQNVTRLAQQQGTNNESDPRYDDRIVKPCIDVSGLGDHR